LAFLFSFDLVRSTQQMGQIRYFVPAAPPLFIALTICISRFSKPVKTVIVLVLSLFLSVQSLFLINWKYNQWEPFHQAGDFINAGVKADDLLIIRSIPSGIISLSLYLNNKASVVAVSKHIDENMTKDLVDILLKENHGGIWFVTAHTNWSKEYQKTETVINDQINKKRKRLFIKSFGRGKGKIDVTYFK
jgi:hypothetical protein